jgi:PhnB protein
MAVTPIPDGYHTVTPYIVSPDASATIEFAKHAFGAREHHVMRGPDGTVMHADVVIGSSHVMIGQAGGPNKAFPAMLYLYVPDVDATFQQAVAAGGTALHPVSTQFYGDRHGAIADAAGNQWWIATHVEDVPDEELRRRAEDAMRQRAATT